jgi:hypothetical protein
VNAETVCRWIDAIGVPSEVVSIGVETDNAWCLLRRDVTDTGDGPEWEVFWREQGNRYDWARFSNEQVACYYLFGRLACTQVASGALRHSASHPHPVTPQDGGPQDGGR